MLVKRGGRDERGSAVVSVLVMMLVLTLFALTLATIVTNTGSSLANGRKTSQSRAAADAGVAAALAAFLRAEACTGTVSSATAPVYSATCVAGATSVTFVSTGRGEGGIPIRIQAVYAYTTAQSFEAKVGQLTFFSATGAFESNIVTASTPSPARIVVVGGNFQCKSAMAANLVVEKDFYAYSGCMVTGWVKAIGSTTMYGGSSVGKELTSGGSATLNPASSVGGSLTSGGFTKLGSGSSVGGDLVSGGYADLDSGTSVGGDLTSTGYSDVEGTVKGKLAAGGYAVTGYNSSIAGSVTAAGVGRTSIRGTVGKDVAASGPVTIDYNSVVTGNVTAAGTSPTEIYGTVGGDLAAGGKVFIQSNGRVTGNATSAGTELISVDGTITGNLKAAGAVTVNGTVSGDVTAAGTDRSVVKGSVTGSLRAAGAVTIDYNRTVSGEVTAAGPDVTLVNGTIGGSLKAAGAVTVNGTVSGDLNAAGAGLTSVNGTVNGSLRAAGTVTVNYNRPVRGDVATSGTGTDHIYGQISGNLNAGGPINLHGGSVGGSLTLPDLTQLVSDVKPWRVAGTMTSKEGPPAPGAPSAPVAPTAPPSASEVKVSQPASPTVPTWQDYGYSSADWPGYTVSRLDKTSSWCGARNWATYLGTFTAPTVVDATACKKGLDEHPTSATTVTVSANVVVVSSEIDLQYATFTPAAGTNPRQWFIVPSAEGVVKAYANTPSGNGDINLDSSNLGIATLLYTPARIGYHTSRFTGSMYSRSITFDGGTPGDIKAAPVEFPIALFESTQSTTPAVTFSVTRVSQREVA